MGKIKGWTWTLRGDGNQWVHNDSNHYVNVSRHTRGKFAGLWVFGTFFDDIDNIKYHHTFPDRKSATLFATTYMKDYSNRVSGWRRT